MMGELTRGGGEVGGGGVEHFPSTKAIKGEGDRALVEAATEAATSVGARGHLRTG